MTKRAFLVLGPGTSGMRLMTRLLIAAGCYGDDGDDQRLDHGLPADEALIVWRRSLPHRGEWPDLRAMIRGLEAAGYETTAIVMSGKPDPNIVSTRISQVYAQIFYALHVTSTLGEIVDLDALTKRPAEVVGHLMHR